VEALALQGENLNGHYPHEYAGVTESDKGVEIVTRLLEAVKLHGTKPELRGDYLDILGTGLLSPEVISSITIPIQTGIAASTLGVHSSL